MHISYISPLSGWYLAQARPDLTAKDPTQYEIGAAKGSRNLILSLEG